MLQYIVDYTNKRRTVPLGTVEKPEMYGVGDHVFTFEAETINVLELRKTLLLNVALLHVALYDGDREVQQIALVTQVTKSPHDGTFQRNVFNPLKSVPSKYAKEETKKKKKVVSDKIHKDGMPKGAAAQVFV